MSFDGSAKIELTPDELRRIVFETSVAYASTILEGGSVQLAEWARMAKMEKVLLELKGAGV